VGRLAEVNQTLAIGLKLFDGATNQFPRVRVYNSAGTEQTAAPFSSPIALTHRAVGFYSATVTPTAEGEFFIVYQVYSDAGFTTLNKKYEEVIDVAAIRSVDQDLSTLLTRVGTPVGTVSSDIAGIQTKLGTPAGASVSVDILSNFTRLGAPVGASISADLAAVKADTGSIKTTVDTNLNATVSSRLATASYTAPDNATIGTINTKIGTPLGTVSTDIAGVQTKLGTPAGASVSVDVAAVKADTGSIKTTVDTNLNATVSSRLPTSGYTAPDNATIGTINTKIGTPAGASVSADVAAVKVDTAAILVDTGTSGVVVATADQDAIVDKVWDELAGSHVAVGSLGANLDAKVSTRATQTSVDAIQNNTNFVGVVQSPLIKPASGSVNYKFYGRLFDSAGSPEDPDTNLMNIRIETVGGSVVVATAAMTRTGVGQYEYLYSVLAADAERPLVVFMEYAESAIAFQHIRTTEVQEFETTLDAIKLDTTAIKAKTDQLAFTATRVNSVISTTQEDDIVDKVWDELQADHVDVGSLGARLDATVSSRESDVAAGARNTATLTAIGGVGTTASVINAKIGVPVVSVSADIAAVKAVVDGISMGTTPQVIANAVWDELASAHTVLGSFGRGLAILFGDASTLNAVDIAIEVWNSAVASFGAGGTFGERITNIKNRLDIVDGKTDLLLNERLPLARAERIDHLDANISSLETEASASSRAATDQAEHDITQAALDAVLLVIGTPFPELSQIIALLENVTYGLANLRIQLDGKASLAGQVGQTAQLTSIQDALANATTGLAALLAAIVNQTAPLTDVTFGLAAIKSELNLKSTTAQVGTIPTSSQIRDAVWNQATAALTIIGSIGKLIADNLNDTISSRSSSAQAVAIAAQLTSVLTRLDNATYGLAALQVEHDNTQASLGVVDLAVANVDTDLATARADILAAISALVNGTPTIIAALDVIKGGGFVAGDDLHSIRLAIGTGSATLAKQDDILAELADIKGGGFNVLTDSLEKIRDESTVIEAQLAQARLSIETKVDVVDDKVDAVDSKATGIDNKLTNITYGLPAIKSAVDSGFSSNSMGIAIISGQVSAVNGLIVSLSAQLSLAEAGILSEIQSQDTAAIQVTVNGIVSLLQNATYGLSAIRTALDSFRTAEQIDDASKDTLLNSIVSSISTVVLALDAIKGVGFSAGDSLAQASIKLASILAEFPLLATSVQGAAIILRLHELADGNTGSFDPDTDSLAAIGEKQGFIEGFEAGGA